MSWNNFENFLHLFHFLSNQILKVYQNTISILTWKYSYYSYPLLNTMLCMRCSTCINQLNELYENSFHFTNEKISSEKLSSTEVTRKHREQKQFLKNNMALKNRSAWIVKVLQLPYDNFNTLQGNSQKISMLNAKTSLKNDRKNIQYHYVNMECQPSL